MNMNKAFGKEWIQANMQNEGKTHIHIFGLQRSVLFHVEEKCIYVHSDLYNPKLDFYFDFPLTYIFQDERIVPRIWTP